MPALSHLDDTRQHYSQEFRLLTRGDPASPRTGRLGQMGESIIQGERLLPISGIIRQIADVNPLMRMVVNAVKVNANTADGRVPNKPQSKQGAITCGHGSPLCSNALDRLRQ